MWEPVSNFIPTWDHSKEKSIEGVYVGMDTVKTKHGEKEIYVLEKSDGTKVGVFKSVNLAFRMEGDKEKKLPGVEIGTKIKITHDGKFKNEKSGKFYNSYRVMKWRENGTTTADEEPKKGNDVKNGIESSDNIPF